MSVHFVGWSIVMVFGLVSGCGLQLPSLFDGETGLHADAGRSVTAATTGGADTAIVNLDGSGSANPAGSIMSYAWFHGDEQIAAGVTAQIELPPGQFEITLVVIDEDGRTASDTILVTVSVDPPVEFSLRIEVMGEGETVPPAGRMTYPAGTNVALLAIPAEGFRFARWTGAIESDIVAADVALDADKFVTAEFTPLGADAPPRFFLPWAAGRAWRINQGNDDPFSHAGLFAWDIPMPIETPIVAVGAGRVVDVLERSLRNSPGATVFGQPANFVTIDHGNGLQSLYAHLDFLGATVEPGQRVGRGQVIGFSGNTGVSTGPHLHYEMLDVHGASVSTGFVEVTAEDGIPMEDDIVTSANLLDVDSVRRYAPSSLPYDAFLINGIELTGELPPAFFYTTETDYVITGRVLDGKTRVCAALVDPDSFETVFCDLTAVEDNGAFSIPVRFPAELSGRHWYGVISGSAGAEGVTPISIMLTPPMDASLRPVAVIDQPEDAAVDFLQTRSLSGSHSVSSAGRALSYQWMQASGPPATIADRTAAETEFTVELGAGVERVSFQLVVFDGELHSFPDQVDFKMPDNFFVSHIGVADTLCQSVDACPVFDPPPPLISFSTQVVMGWVEVVGVELGDELGFSLSSPLGTVVRSKRFTLVALPTEISFWQFAWTSLGLDLLPGIWTGSFERNGVVEATIDLRVTP